MPVMRPTANSIWRSFQTSGKKHLVLTGASGSGKTTLLASLFSSPMPGVTSWVVPEKGVYLKNNCSKEIIQIGRYHPDPTHKRNQMLAIPESFDEKGTAFLHSCLHATSEWITIDEIGFLESNSCKYRQAIRTLMKHKQLLMVVRKQKLPFLEELRNHKDVFLVDLDQPYGNAGCIIMASGQGTRFGGNKLLADFNGQPLINSSLNIIKNLFTASVVVTIHKEIQSLCIKQNIPVLLHNFPHRNDMIRLGLETIGNHIDRCVFLPADQPLLQKESMISLLLCAENDRNSIWRTCYGDIVGSPVIFPAEFFEELQNLPLRKGGSLVINNHPDRIRTISVSDINELRDIDTPDDLSQLLHGNL